MAEEVKKKYVFSRFLNYYREVIGHMLRHNGARLLLALQQASKMFPAAICTISPVHKGRV